MERVDNVGTHCNRVRGDLRETLPFGCRTEKCLLNGRFRAHTGEIKPADEVIRVVREYAFEPPPPEVNPLERKE